MYGYWDKNGMNRDAGLYKVDPEEGAVNHPRYYRRYLITVFFVAEGFRCWHFPR